MTDYAVGTGSGGSLILRDDGFNLTAIIKSTNGSTFASGKAWSIQVGAGSASGTFSLSGVGERVVWQGTLGGSARVIFNMGATGTSGLGGPTTLTVDINRATVPEAPTTLGWSEIGVSIAVINFAGNGSGGATVDYYLVRYGTANPPEAGPYVEFTTGTGRNPIGGLSTGTRYYYRVYAHNAMGYSAPSAVSEMITQTPTRVKIGGTYRIALPYVKVAGVYKLSEAYKKIAGTYRRTG
jgi:hypothetical protein